MNRRFPALLSLATVSLAMTASQVSDRPNIIMFMVDDMGWQETSVPFWHQKTLLNERYHTPNMERLAAMGVKFTNAYACSISSPTRCSFISGMNQARHRVTNWTLKYNTPTDAKDDEVTPPQWYYNGVQPDTCRSPHDRYLSTLITALPEILKDHGYYTIHCGKAHFGSMSTSAANPINLGFMVNIAGAANGGPGSYLAEDNYGKGPFHVQGLDSYYKKGTFLSEALTIEALKALQVPIAEHKPFFLYMSHYAIHIPYNPDKRFTKNYRDSTGQGIYDPMLKARLNTNEINHAALVEGMDKSLGDIMNFLDKHPDVAKNTIIIFMSDNGGQAIAVRQGVANRDQNYPARGGKGSALEGGVHEPMLVYWPGVTKGGTVNTNRVMIEDFFPTILEMAGIKKYRTSQVVDGKSFVNVLKNPSLHRDREIIWHSPHIWTTGVSEKNGYGPTSSIMKGNYHLIYYWRTNTYELYNNKEDITELHDLSKTHPEIAKAMLKRLFTKLKEMKALYPTVRAKDGTILKRPSLPFVK